MTPPEMRAAAIDLIRRADAAEGYHGESGFVTRWEVLAELATLRGRLEKLTAATGLLAE